MDEFLFEKGKTGKAKVEAMMKSINNEASLQTL